MCVRRIKPTEKLHNEALQANQAVLIAGSDSVVTNSVVYLLDLPLQFFSLALVAPLVDFELTDVE